MPPSEANQAAGSGPSAAAGSPAGLAKHEAAADDVVEAAGHASVAHHVLHEELAGGGGAALEAAGAERGQRGV
ncbi:MAG: hypothetical protein ACHQ3O_09295, partial [Candidatus Limnocylindria bacterium]